MCNSRVIFLTLAGATALHAGSLVSATCEILVTSGATTIEHLTQSGSSCGLISPTFGGPSTTSDATVSDTFPTPSSIHINAHGLVAANPPNVAPFAGYRGPLRQHST